VRAANTILDDKPLDSLGFSLILGATIAPILFSARDLTSPVTGHSWIRKRFKVSRQRRETTTVKSKPVSASLLIQIVHTKMTQSSV
jgi:hypothetical protein